MNLTVALDSPRRRDLDFFEGDASVINITVLQKDGDAGPIAVSNVALNWGYGDYQVGSINSGTTFPADFNRRSTYSITGNVNGSLTTLAYGLINRGWDPTLYVCTPNCDWSGDNWSHSVAPELTFLCLEDSDVLTTEAGDLLYLS